MKSNLLGAGALQNYRKTENLGELIAALFRDDYVQFIADSLCDLGISFRRRFYTPFNTLWIFIGQVLSSDHSCRDAVAQFISRQSYQGVTTCSYATGAYCTARKRLPVELITRLFRKSVGKIVESDNHLWFWRGLRVKLVDGTTVALENTQDIQKRFPSHVKKKKGDVGSPTAKIVAVISLSCGAVLDAVIGPCVGKNTSENVLFNRLVPGFDAQDLLIFDRYFSGFFNLLSLFSRQCAFVGRQNQRRKHFTIVKNISSGDRVIRVPRPWRDKDSWWSVPSIYNSAPPYIDLREITFQIAIPGFRVQKIVLITNLLDSETYSKLEIETLYRKRWEIEVDFRAIKQDLKMGILRSKTADMVVKEIWMHLITYNLIRSVMLTAATFHEIKVRDISFKATVQLFISFREKALCGMTENDFAAIIEKVPIHKVGNRPNRVEPRKIVRDRRVYPTILTTRKQWKKEHGLI